MPRLKCLIAAFTATAALGGCGGSEDADEAPSVPDEERAVLRTIDALQAASRDGDAGRICTEIFTRELASSIREAAGRSCQAEVRGTLVAPDAQISVERGIQLDGQRARATVREQNGETSRILLVKQGGRWRIERITPARS